MKTTAIGDIMPREDDDEGPSISIQINLLLPQQMIKINKWSQPLFQMTVASYHCFEWRLQCYRTRYSGGVSIIL
jgi:hypothetical protein